MTHAYNDSTSLVGFTTEFDKASNKYYERELHAENRSHLYEPREQGPIAPGPITSQAYLSEWMIYEPQQLQATGGYDSLDRLRQYRRGTLSEGGDSVTTPISLPNTDENRDFELDGLGNWRRTNYDPVGGSETEEIRQHNGLNQITKRDSTQFSHDLNGNLLDDGVRLYQWDAFNRLLVVKRKSDNATIGEYIYDARTFRIQKTVSNGGLTSDITNGTTDFIYNAGWQCLEERDSSNDPTKQYVWGTYIDELIQQRNDIDTTPIDQYPLQDLLYRTTALTNSSGSIIEAYDTDAYGNTLIFSDAGTGGDWWADDASQSNDTTCDFIFTSRQFDTESQLYQYRYRYYEPVLGRFLGRDPLNYFAGQNLLEYVNSQPELYLDPFGLCVICSVEIASKSPGEIDELLIPT